MNISRRLFLHNAAAASAVGATLTVPAVAEPVHPITPDERITAAIDEIKAAMWEKWPDAPIRITDCDNGDNGMILIVTHLEKDKPGSVHHNRIGAARTVEGGAA